MWLGSLVWFCCSLGKREIKLRRNQGPNAGGVVPPSGNGRPLALFLVRIARQGSRTGLSFPLSELSSHRTQARQRCANTNAGLRSGGSRSEFEPALVTAQREVLSEVVCSTRTGQSERPRGGGREARAMCSRGSSEQHRRAPVHAAPPAEAARLIRGGRRRGGGAAAAAREGHVQRVKRGGHALQQRALWSVVRRRKSAERG